MTEIPFASRILTDARCTLIAAYLIKCVANARISATDPDFTFISLLYASQRPSRLRTKLLMKLSPLPHQAVIFERHHHIFPHMRFVSHSGRYKQLPYPPQRVIRRTSCHSAPQSTCVSVDPIHSHNSGTKLGYREDANQGPRAHLTTFLSEISEELTAMQLLSTVINPDPTRKNPASEHQGAGIFRQRACV